MRVHDHSRPHLPHCDGSDVPLVSNKGFDNEEQQNGNTSVVAVVNGMDTSAAADSASASPLAAKLTTSTSRQHHQRQPQPATEEIALQAMEKSEEHQRLCACEEEGKPCQCLHVGRRQQQPVASEESWNRCKTMSLLLVTVLVALWVVVYVSLSQTRML